MNVQKCADTSSQEPDGWMKNSEAVQSGAPGSVLTGLDTPQITKKTCPRLSWTGNITTDVHMHKIFTKAYFCDTFGRYGDTRGLVQMCIKTCMLMSQNNDGPNSDGPKSDGQI